MVIVLSVNNGMKYYWPKKADILTKTQKLGRIDRG